MLKSKRERAKLIADSIGEFVTRNYPHHGLTVTAKIEQDETMGAPWEEHDGHGKVRWSRTKDKSGGERIMSGCQRDGYYIYDYAASIKIARNKWVSNEPRETDGLTIGQRAVNAVESDFKYCHDWLNDQWHWVQFIVKIKTIDPHHDDSEIEFDEELEGGFTLDMDSLCGMDDDPTYINSEIRSAIARLLWAHRHHAKAKVLT